MNYARQQIDLQFNKRGTPHYGVTESDRSLKRIKRESITPVKKPPVSVTPSPNIRRKPPTRGVVRIPLPEGSEDASVQNIVHETIERLSEEGKTVEGIPRLLGDGITFDWILDYSKREEYPSRSNLAHHVRQCSSSNFLEGSSLSVARLPQGYSRGSGTRVSRVPDQLDGSAGSSSEHGHTTLAEQKDYIMLDSDPRYPGSGIDVAHAIIVSDSDDDEGDSSTRNALDNALTNTSILCDNAEEGLGAGPSRSRGDTPSERPSVFNRSKRASSSFVPPRSQSKPGQWRTMSESEPESDKTSSEEELEPSELGDPTAVALSGSGGDSAIERIFQQVSQAHLPKGLANRKSIKDGDYSSDATSSRDESSDSDSDRDSESRHSDNSRRASSGSRLTAPQAIRPTGTSSRNIKRRLVDSAPSHRHSEVTARTASPVDNGHSIIIPKAEYARARRVLITNSLIITIAMRGNAHFIRRKERVSYWSLPPDKYRHVEDAFVIGDTIVVGYSAGPCQVSLLHLSPTRKDKKPRPADVDHTAHNAAVGSRDDNQGGRAISCLAPIQGDHELKFISGGYDKRLFCWTIDATGNASSTKLPAYHSSPVHAVAYRARDRTLLSSAGAGIYEMNLDRPCDVKPIKKSTSIRHIHVHGQEPNLVLLEMKDKDCQIQIYDIRQGGFDRSPCLKFGRDEHQVKRSTRYRRGSSHMSYFALGYSDGVVTVWDYRKPAAIALRLERSRLEPIVHTAFSASASEVVAYGGHVLTSWTM